MAEREEIFTLKVWKESLDSTNAEWRGKISHLTTGEVIYFRNWSKMMEFIDQSLPKDGRVQNACDLTELRKPRLPENDVPWQERMDQAIKPVQPLPDVGGVSAIVDRIDLRSILPEMDNLGSQVINTFGYFTLGTLAVMLGWGRVSGIEPETAALISGVAALYMGSMLVSHTIRRLRNRLFSH